MSKMKEMALDAMEKFRKEDKQNDHLHPWVAYKEGYTQGWKDCLKHGESVRELVQSVQTVLTEQLNAKLCAPWIKDDGSEMSRVEVREFAHLAAINLNIALSKFREKVGE